MTKRANLSNLLLQIVAAASNEARSYTICDDLSIVAPTGAIGPAADGRKTEITMISDDLNVTLGIYIRLATAKEIYSKQSKKPIAEIDDKLAVDFMQELVNRCIGVVKRMLVDSGVFRKTNLFLTELPINGEQTAALDPKAALATGLWDEAWVFKSGLGQFLCWAKIHEKASEIIEQLATIKFSPSKNDGEGEVDFL